MNQSPNQFYPSNSSEIPAKVQRSLDELWNRVNWLLGQVQQLNLDAQTKPGKDVEQRLTQLQFALQTVSDSLTQGSVFGSFGSNQPVAPTASVTISATGDGITISGSSASGSVSVSSPSTLRTVLNVAQRISPLLAPGTLTLAKITGGGTDGSITLDADGRVTAYVAPT